MRGIFFGTSAFAVPALRAFASSLECALVVTQPERRSGRGQKLRPTAVKLAALELGISVCEPTHLRDAFAQIRAVEPDLFAVASYGKILPGAVLDVPRYGALNVHPSLLPLYRGATPLQAQLRDGVTRGGVTIILMDAGMDTGDIVLAEPHEIGAAETYGELHDRFATIGAAMLARACAAVEAGSVARTPQPGLASDEDVVRTSTRPLTKGDLLVDWRWHARRIVNHVRAFAPQPGARARLDGEADLVKILQARVATAATAATEDALVVPCGAGEFVAIERLVAPNRAPMSGSAYVASVRATAARLP